MAARAQQGGRVRRIGVLMNLAAEDPVSSARAKAFAEGLHALGWIDGRNVHVDYRWAARAKPICSAGMQRNLWLLSLMPY
jgi:putative ABC transport system substrate-binding protein